MKHNPDHTLLNVAKISLLVFIAFWVYRYLYWSQYSNFIFDDLIALFAGVVGLIVFGVFSHYELNLNKKRKPVGFITGVILFAGAVGLHYKVDSKLNAPSALQAYNGFGSNGVKLDFKSNGTLLITNGGFLGCDIFHARFEFKNDTVLISGMHDLISKKLLLPKELRNPNLRADSMSIFDTYIVQLDDKNVALDQGVRFKITQDLNFP